MQLGYCLQLRFRVLFVLLEVTVIRFTWALSANYSLSQRHLRSGNVHDLVVCTYSWKLDKDLHHGVLPFLSDDIVVYEKVRICWGVVYNSWSQVLGELVWLYPQYLHTKLYAAVIWSKFISIRIQSNAVSLPDASSVFRKHIPVKFLFILFLEQQDDMGMLQMNGIVRFEFVWGIGVESVSSRHSFKLMREVGLVCRSTH